MLYVYPHKQHFKASILASIYSFKKLRLENSNTGICTHVSPSPRHILFLDVTLQRHVLPFGNECVKTQIYLWLAKLLNTSSLHFHLSHRSQWKLNKWTQV